MTILKYIGATIVGLIVGVILVGGIEKVSSMIYPIPETIDQNNLEEMKAFIKTLPVGAFLFVLGAWCAGAFAGASVATVMSPNRGFRSGSLVICLLWIGGIINMALIPHPVWFWVAGIACFPVFGGFGLWIASRTRAVSN